MTSARPSCRDVTPLWIARRRRARREAQGLLDVPAGYGGWGCWLDQRHQDELQRLLDRCRDDVALLGGAGFPGDAADHLRRLPCGVAPHDRFLAGLFDGGGEMSAFVDVSRDHPTPGDWWVAALLVRPDLRGCGVAAALAEALERWVAAEGGGALHLPVPYRNASGFAFARRVGFTLRGERPLPTPAGAARVAHLVRRVG